MTLVPTRITHVPIENGMESLLERIKAFFKKGVGYHNNVVLFDTDAPPVVGRQLTSFRIRFKSGSTYAQISVDRGSNMDGDEYEERIVWSGMIDIIGSDFQEGVCRMAWKRILEYRQELAMADVHRL